MNRNWDSSNNLTDRTGLGIFNKMMEELTMENLTAACSKCKVKDKICENEGGRGPEYCPTIIKKDVIRAAMIEYGKPEVGEFARQASIQEAECYANRGIDPFVLHPIKTRVQETVEFAKKMNFKTIGIAFCAGLRKEASTLTDIIEAHDFKVVSTACATGGIPKESIGIKEDEKVAIGKFEQMCNPISQAMVLNDDKTDFNILLGLCVGHDSLFIKYANAYTTVLVVKDRVLGHNPVAALYTADGYYQRLKRKDFNSVTQSSSYSENFVNDI